MLQVENLCKSYAGEIVFEELSFCLQKGEKCALLGRNGSGKTTLLKILKGDETADSGNISIPRQYKLGFLEQHIQFTKGTVLEEALDGPIIKQPYEVESILFGLGFTEDLLDASPASLSGGYHLRLKLAKLLALQPDCLLLDEPTNYLDISGLRWLERYLKQWKGECILISHDRSFLDAIATHTMGLHRKKLRKYAGGTENFYQKILEEEEIYEKTRGNLDKKKKHLEEYIERFGAKASKATQAKSKAKSLEKLPALVQLSAIENLSFSFNYLPFHGKRMISLQDVSFGYEKDKLLIKNFSLDVERSQKIAIIGENGVGKSTLLQLFAQDFAPTRGQVASSEQTKIGYFGQTNISRLPMDETIEDVISLANPKLNYTQVRAICGNMMFSKESAQKKISLLSGGERSRVLLGKILASPTNLLLLDEPTHHLDIESIEALIEAMEEFEGALVLITHSEEILKRIETDYLVFCQKEKQHVFLGSYQDFLEKDGWNIFGADKSSSPPKKSQEKKRKERPASLQEEISFLEEKIALKEKKQQEFDSPLVQKDIDSLYEKLEKLYRELEK